MVSLTNPQQRLLILHQSPWILSTMHHGLVQLFSVFPHDTIYRMHMPCNRGMQRYQHLCAALSILDKVSSMAERLGTTGFFDRTMDKRAYVDKEAKGIASLSPPIHWTLGFANMNRSWLAVSTLMHVIRDESEATAITKRSVACNSFLRQTLVGTQQNRCRSGCAWPCVGAIDDRWGICMEGPRASSSRPRRVLYYRIV